MKLFQTTHQWEHYWTTRLIDWDKSYLNGEDAEGRPAWAHPHRFRISHALSMFNWSTLFEVGMGAGANLVNILKSFPGKKMTIGGSDISPEAIALAQKTFTGGFFKVCPTTDIGMSDDAVDVILSDMSLIYIGPRSINRALEEIKRVARDRVILCEFHSTSLWRRFLLRWKSGYNSYNYQQLLTQHGFYDIQFHKLTEADWPGGHPQKEFGFLIRAKVQRRK